MNEVHANDRAATRLYLDLMKRTLSFSLWGTTLEPLDSERARTVRGVIRVGLAKLLRRRGVALARIVPYDATARLEGRDHPPLAHTMIGLKRLDNIQECVEQVLRENVPGDFIETGVWRGGATIFMRALLEAHAVMDRKVWVADSFEGLPRPDESRYPADKGDQHYLVSHLAVGLDEVKENFARFGLLDEQVVFLKGWFRDTLPRAPIERLAVMRLDGDMYESTYEALSALYPRLSSGGFVIVDDYGYLESCRRAVHDFRQAHGIDEPIVQIDWSGVYWRRGPAPNEQVL